MSRPKPSREDKNRARMMVERFLETGEDPNDEIGDACAFYGHILGNVPKLTLIDCLIEYWNEVKV